MSGLTPGCRSCCPLRRQQAGGRNPPSTSPVTSDHLRGATVSVSELNGSGHSDWRMWSTLKCIRLQYDTRGLVFTLLITAALEGAVMRHLTSNSLTSRIFDSAGNLMEKNNIQMKRYVILMAQRNCLRLPRFCVKKLVGYWPFENQTLIKKSDFSHL